MSRAWLMKSCFPNPQDHIIIKQPSSSSPISALSDDLLLECLCRASRSSLPTLPLVCRRWSSLIHSPSFLHLRRQLRLLQPTLFTLLTTNRFAAFHVLRFWAQLGQTSQINSASWNTTASFSLPTLFPCNARLVAIGPCIYIIGRSSTLRCNIWTGNVTPRSQMIYSRKSFAAAVVAGKIYVAGGGARASALEEYDPGNNMWCVVSEAPRRRYGCIGTSLEGIFYIIGGLKIGQGGTEAHHVYTSSMDLYEVDTSTWLKSRAVPGGGCIVAACSANGYVYILASHAVELSFWRFDGRRGKSFGEWQKLKSPRYTRLDNTLRFSCVGIGNKVVLIQVMGCQTKRALVTVYDCEGGEWSRGPDIPDAVPRAACVYVEC